MNFEKELNSLPLLRPWGLPFNPGRVCLVTLFQNLEHLPAYLKARENLIIEAVIACNAPRPLRGEIPVGKAHGGKAPLLGMADIGKFPQCAKVFMFPSAGAVSMFCHEAGKFGVEQVWLDGIYPPPFGIRPPVSDFYAKNAEKLANACSLLATWEDQRVYIARVKAIITGNAGYMPIGPFPEYEHPVIRPLPCDVMIDGGLSDMVWSQEAFAKNVGEHGRIIGFEPIGWMAEKAAATLAPYPQYKVVAKGLSDKAGEANFASLRDSSHICANAGNGTEKCQLTTIDDVAREEHLEKVDCIKLDIEGAELSALKGAARTICQFRPKLIICLYHKPEDLITIPFFIKELVPQYNLHVAHSSSDFTDTILYAEVPH